MNITHNVIITYVPVVYQTSFYSMCFLFCPLQLKAYLEDPSAFAVAAPVAAAATESAPAVKEEKKEESEEESDDDMGFGLFD